MNDLLTNDRDTGDDILKFLDTAKSATPHSWLHPDDAKAIADRLRRLESHLTAADDIVKAFLSPGVNNQVWVAIEYYRSLRGEE